MKKNRLLKFLKPKMSINDNLAIVGSSSSILRKNFGQEIDTYHDVIRFNRSPVENYEKFVGSKTTIRVVNKVVFENYESEDNKNQTYPVSTNFLEKTKIITISSSKITYKKKAIPITLNKFFFFRW